MDAGKFTEDEKRFVLAEYIKASKVETEQLVAFIKMYHLQADWFSMQLPGGRNMHQCMRAASDMLDIDLEFPSMPNLKKRKSVSDLEHAPKRVASIHPIQYQPRMQPRPQAQTPPLPQIAPQISQAPSSTAPRAVSIQPRPFSESKSTTSEGYGVFQSKAAPPNGYNVFQSNPTGRKRGRPSKAEKEAQAQARASSSSYTTGTPVPISPKPLMPLPSSSALQPSTAHYATVASVNARTPSGGPAGEMAQPRNLPTSYTEQASSSVKSEKSPSIGNLVTPDPSGGPRGSLPAPLPDTSNCDAPTATNST